MQTARANTRSRGPYLAAQQACIDRRALHSPTPSIPMRTLAAPSCSVHQPERSVQPEHAVDGANFRRSDQTAVANRDRIEPPLELGLPKLQETLQLRKIRAEIVILPNIGLQQPGMVGSPIHDFGGCQAVSLHLSFEVRGDHFGSLVS